MSIAIETVYTQQTGADHVQVYITIKCEVLKVDKVRHGPKQHEQQHLRNIKSRRLFCHVNTFKYGINSVVITNCIKTILFSRLRDKYTGIFKEYIYIQVNVEK